jgi:hypothetical protein
MFTKQALKPQQCPRRGEAKQERRHNRMQLKKTINKHESPDEDAPSKVARPKTRESRSTGFHKPTQSNQKPFHECMQ